MKYLILKSGKPIAVANSPIAAQDFIMQLPQLPAGRYKWSDSWKLLEHFGSDRWRWTGWEFRPVPSV
jgi:hypothetical protein